ncbi:MAG: hypothetical protein R3Y24_02160, partial [Eubacteriales bacterium]
MNIKMKSTMINMYQEMGISKEVWAFGESKHQELKPRFQTIDEIAEYNQLKVLQALQKNKV